MGLLSKALREPKSSDSLLKKARELRDRVGLDELDLSTDSLDEQKKKPSQRY